MAKIRVLSLDYDGCLARRNFAANIKEHNQSLISYLRVDNNRQPKTVVFIGSNRQSKRDDDRNSQHSRNGSCYQYIPIFAEAIGAEFDPFLISDAYNDVRSGTTFQEAIDNLDNDSFKHKGWLHDKSKISVIYCQMQKIAHEHPNEEIDFEFFDDKGDILDGLQAFFTANRHLIPRDINLKFRHYAGGDVDTSRDPIIGNGDFVNANYAKSIQSFGNRVLTTLANRRSLYDVEGNEVGLAMIKEQQYNCGVEISVNDYLQHFIGIHTPYTGAPTSQTSEVLSANFFIQILASKEMKIFAGVVVIAGLAALTIGTLGIAGVITALAGTAAAIIATSVGSAAIICGAGLGGFSFFASKHQENLSLPNSTQPCGI